MNILKVLYTFFILLSISCTNKYKDKVVYSKDGYLKESLKYYSKDTSSFLFTSFYENGKIKEVYNKKNNRIEGNRMEYFPNGQVKSCINYVNGFVDGIVQVYNEYGVLKLYKTYKKDRLWGVYLSNISNNIQQEILFIDDVPLILIDKGYVLNNNDSIYGMTYYYKNHLDTTYSPVGSLSYYINNDTKTIRKRFCNYFEISSKDTINEGEVFNFLITYQSVKEDLKFTLEIGEIDKAYNFVDISRNKIFISKSNILEINLTNEDYKKGINVITGKLKLYDKDFQDITNKEMINVIENVPFIFYKQFYVK